MNPILCLNANSIMEKIKIFLQKQAQFWIDAKSYCSMGPIVWLVHFHRFDHILVDSEDVPEYRGHCSKSSQLGLRPRCLDGPWIRNCTSWYVAKSYGTSTIITLSKYTIITIHHHLTWDLTSFQSILFVWKSSSSSSRLYKFQELLTKLSGRVLGLKVLVDWILLSVTGLAVLA